MKKRFYTRILSMGLAILMLASDISAYAASDTGETLSGNAVSEVSEVSEVSLSGNSVQEEIPVEETEEIITEEITEEEITVSYTPYWEDADFSNLVLFIAFADTDPEHSYRCELLDCFNGDGEEVQGMRQYFYETCEESLKIENIFPQYDEQNGTVKKLVLENNAEYYADDAPLIEEVSELLNSSELLIDGMNLHYGNDENVLDNLTIIVPQELEAETPLFVSHSGEYTGESRVGEDSVKYYNVLTEEDLLAETSQEAVIQAMCGTLERAGLIVIEEEPEYTGFQIIDGKAYIYDENGNYLTGYFTYKEKQYYADKNGVLQNGWKKISGKYRFFNNALDPQEWYELSYTDAGSKGGWIILSDGRKSYLSTKNGMLTGMRTISKKKYYFDSKGIMKTSSWVKSGSYYYYAGKSGYMLKGVWTIGGKKYYFDSSYHLSTGWKKISGKYRFFNNASNYLNRYELSYTDKGNTGGWVTLSDGRRSYISTKKGVFTGWHTISGNKYYFSAKGIMQKGWETIGGKKYFFNRSGIYIPMKKPTISSVSSSAYGKATIKWNKITGVDDYKLQYSTSSKFTSSTTKSVTVNNTTSHQYTLKDLTPNKTYYFRIRYTAQGGTASNPEQAISSYSAAKSIKIKGEVAATATSATVKSCYITSGSRNEGITVYFKATLSQRLKSADKKYYIVQTESYGTAIDVAKPCAEVNKDFTVSVKFDITGADSGAACRNVNRALMNKFALAIKKSDGTYQVVSTPKAITNPEKISENTGAILKTVSKKGIQGAGFADAADTNSKHTLFNLDLADLVGTKAASGYVAYQYKGKTYYFKDCSNLVGEFRQMTEGYDQYIQGETGEKTKISVTLCILLSYKASNSYLIDKAARTKGHSYYMLNVREEKARETLEAAFLYLGEIFGQEDCYVTNWVLGNEVNSSKAWNYSGSLSQSTYMKCYASAFRLLYNGVKASKSGNNVFISLDNGWCAAPDTYTGKSTLDKFASYAQKENPKMQWSIAYHGYSYPLTRNDFWNDTKYTTSKTTTKYISMKNISVLTKYAASLEEKYNKPSGSIRVILSEQGYNAAKEKQAYALARGYYMAEFNSRIDAFIIRALQDAEEEMKGGLYFGIRNRYEEKRTSYYVYENMDSSLTYFGNKTASKYVSSSNVNKFKEAQKILCKTAWADIIPNFKKSKLAGMY